MGINGPISILNHKGATLKQIAEEEPYHPSSSSSFPSHDELPYKTSTPGISTPSQHLWQPPVPWAMGNCNVTGGNMVGCSLRGETAAGCSAHRAAAVLAPRHRAGARVRVMAGSGRVTEFDAPIQAGDVLAGHPRHGVFRVGDVSSPLPCREQLQSGRLYYLLPLDQKRAAPAPHAKGSPRRPAASKVDPWPELSGSLEVLTPPMKGVWSIKLVISAEQLAGILAEQGNTEALIERVRMLASRAEAMATSPAKQQGAAARKAPPALSTRSHAHQTCERF